MTMILLRTPPRLSFSSSRSLFIHDGCCILRQRRRLQNNIVSPSYSYFFSSSSSSSVCTTPSRLRQHQPWRRSLTTNGSSSSNASSSSNSSSFLPHYPHHHHPLQQIVLWRQKPLLEKIGHYLRLVRLPIVAYGIYTLGFQQGVITSHQNPLRFQQELIDAVLVANAPKGTQRADIHVVVVSETDLEHANKNDNNNAQARRPKDAYHQVATVAQQLIQQARQHVEKEYLQAIEVARRRILQQHYTNHHNLTAPQLDEQVHRDPKVKFWHQAQQRISGGTTDALDVNDPWKFLFVGGNASPNAWVSEMLPKKIFITKSMLEFTQSIDEVAFILSHELAHFILGHVSTANQIEVTLKVTEIVLLAMDPTAGLVTFCVVIWLDFVRRCISRKFSRRHEQEADALGLQLVRQCNAGYDLEAGARFMERLSRNEKGNNKNIISLLETHPPSLERAQQLRKDCRAWHEAEAAAKNREPSSSSSPKQ